MSQQEELPLYLTAPVWLFTGEVTLGGTVVPPENPHKKCCQSQRKSVRWLCGVKAQRLLHTCCHSEIILSFAWIRRMNRKLLYSKLIIIFQQIDKKKKSLTASNGSKQMIRQQHKHFLAQKQRFGWCDGEQRKPGRLQTEVESNTWGRKTSDYEVIVESLD